MERLPFKAHQPSREDLEKIMENKFEEAFYILGQISGSKQAKRAYDLLFDTMQIYKKLKEDK